MTATGRTETLLADAASAAAWPATPDLRATVVARIEATADLRGPVVARIAGTRPEPASPRSPWGRRPLAGAIALALVAVVAVSGIAGALGYRLPGLDIFFVETLPPAGTALDLGSPIPLDEALAVGRPKVLLPASLPPPSTAWLLGAGDRRIVTLAWRADAGRPTLEDSDLELLVMAVPGLADGAFIAKALGQETQIEPVSVNGDRGWWISGGVHELRFIRPDGQAGVLPSRLVGDTLVFSHEGTVYRLESALGRDETLAIAESLR